MNQKFKRRARLHYPEYENNLAELRLAHNMTIAELAKIAESSSGEIGNLQNGYIPPYYIGGSTRNGIKYQPGDLRPSVEKICKHFNETPGDLFPRDICDIQRHELFKDQISELLIGQYSKNEYDIDNWQLKERLLQCLASLRPSQEQTLILRYFYGCTLAETAKQMGYSASERARQLEAAALRHLRHPSNSRHIKDFV